MKIFKLKVGSSKIYELNKNIFELQTKQKKPYYTFNNSNEQIQYAVCPACDNPIQIIGLYKKLKNTDKPYGRHCIHSVAGLAEYNQQAYDFCPYSKKSFNVNPQSRKGKLTDLEKNIYYLLRDQFDRVIYILRQVLDIYILIADLYREKSELEEANKELDEVIKTQAKQIEELNAKLNPDKHVHSQDQGMYPAL